MPAALTGSLLPVALGEGYAIRAPGLQGSADLQRPRPASQRARSRTIEDGTLDFERALDATNVTEVRQVELKVRAEARTAGATLRSASGQEAIELHVPDLGREVGHLVLACDEAGILTWHLPVETPTPEGTTTRGSGAVKRFLIPATPIPPAAPAAGTSRSLLGAVGRKLLKLLVYPVTDPVIGRVSEFFAERWEERYRPYGVRDFSPANFTAKDAPALAADDWTRLAAGPALLFVHGTFSTAHSAFEGLDPQALSALHGRYQGRVFAFNHFTLSHDPADNVAWLFSQIPSGLRLSLDIVSHSRGGLVARTLAERPAALDLPAADVDVNRIVFVGVPNYGTLLANPDHMVTMIDRLTSVLNLFPTGPVTETLEALITAIKVIGHGAVSGLRGLAAMRPGGPFLEALNTGNPSRRPYFAIGADYEPQGPGLRALVRGTLANAALDFVFGDAANDLVVPEAGVYGADGAGSFPLSPQSVLQLPNTAGVLHTTMFAHGPASAKLLDWLA